MTNDWFSKLQEILSPNFEVLKINNDAIFLENQKISFDDYSLDCRSLSEQDILEIGKIVKDVYVQITESRNSLTSDTSQSLNRNTKASGRLVRAILASDYSSLHKFLLLTSSNELLSNENLDVVLALAATKNDACSAIIDVSGFLRVFESLKKLYIFPGVTFHSGLLNSIPVEISSDRSAMEKVIKIMVFLSKESEGLTLQEHLDIDLAAGLLSKESLKTAIALKDVLKIVYSKYEKLAETMTATQLVSLTCILDNATSEGDFPEDILRNRSKAMEIGLQPIGQYEKDSILRYLSKEEQNSISSKTLSDDVNNLTMSQDTRARVPPVILAALAEVLAVKGEKRVLEIARSLEHLRLSRDRNLKMYEATVGIIAEALKPENEDLLFAWIAQMSEHSWVMTSHVHVNQRL